MLHYTMCIPAGLFMCRPEGSANQKSANAFSRRLCRIRTTVSFELEGARRGERRLLYPGNQMIRVMMCEILSEAERPERGSDWKLLGAEAEAEIKGDEM